MRRRAGGVLLGAALCLGAVVVPVAEAASRQELRATNRLTTSTSVVVPVRLTRSVVVSHVDDYTEFGRQPNPHLEVTGRGRVTGLVLTKNGAAARAKEGATLTFLRYGMCAAAACDGGDEVVRALLAHGEGVSRDDNRDVKMPAGDYDLHVVTDGAPVTVRLSFPGLTGSAQLRPVGRTAADVAAATTDGARYTSSSRHRFRGRGMIVVSATTRGDVTTGPTGGFCIVHESERDGPDATDPADAPTACLSRVPASLADQAQKQTPTGSHGSNSGRRWTGADTPGGEISLYASFAPGNYSVGHSWADTPDNRAVAYTTLALGWR